MSIGKQLRLKRVIDPTGVSIICALDHGMTSPVFLEPLGEIATRAEETIAGGANVIMLSKGMIRACTSAFDRTTSLALLLSASANPGGQGGLGRTAEQTQGGLGRTAEQTQGGLGRTAEQEGGRSRSGIVQVAEVEEALRLGADAVVLFVALAGETEDSMIRTLADVGGECDRLGMPFIAEAEFPTTYASVEELKDAYGFDYLARNVRLCAELGADIVKTNWPGNVDSLAKLVAATSGIPVVLAGGSRITDEELLTRMEQAMSVGAIGCSVGRNIFMHENPQALTRALVRVIREGWSATKALEELSAADRDGGLEGGL